MPSCSGRDLNAFSHSRDHLLGRDGRISDAR